MFQSRGGLIKSLYEKYIKERENLDVINTDRGFIAYKFENENCLINDYYVLPEYRQQGHGYFLANQVFELCKELGIKKVFCQSDERANECALSTYTIEHFGFELYHKDGPINHFVMEVSEWEKQ